MIPSSTLSVVIGTCVGLVAHLLGGGDGRRILFLVVVSNVGFIIGETAGDIFSIHLFDLGSTNIIAGFLGAALSAFVASILAQRSRNTS